MDDSFLLCLWFSIRLLFSKRAMCSFPIVVLPLALSIVIGFVLDVDQFLYGLASMRFLVIFV